MVPKLAGGQEMRAKVVMAAILLAELLIGIGIKPKMQNPADFKWFLVMSLGIIVAACIWKLRQLPPRVCTLFGIMEKVTFEKEGTLFQALIQTSECGYPACGMVLTGWGRSEYFCQRHDPESPWMASWLKYHAIKIEKDKIIRFRNSQECRF